MKATDVIRRDHQAAKELFDQYREASEEDRGDMESRILDALDAHEKMEDDYFYPALAGIEGNNEWFKDIRSEQRDMKLGIIELRAMSLFDRQKKMLETFDAVLDHAGKEETMVLPRAEELLGEDALEELGAKMEPVSAAAQA